MGIVSLATPERWTRSPSSAPRRAPGSSAPSTARLRRRSSPAADRLRRAHADPGPDRLGQDAGGVPLRARPAARGARRGHAARLRLAAEGAQLRHRAQPARAARRPPGGRERRGAHGRHAAEGARGDAAPAARPADHDARVAVPDADLARARDLDGRPDADPRRGPCRRRHQAGALTSRSPSSASSA